MEVTYTPPTDPALHDLAPLLREVSRVLVPKGLFAFTVETHDGEGVILGGGLRYAHGASYVRSAIGAAGLKLLGLVAPGAWAIATDPVGENVPNV